MMAREIRVLPFRARPSAACGIAWNESVRWSGVQLPEGDEASGRARMQARFPGVLRMRSAAARVQAAMARIQRAARRPARRPGGHAAGHGRQCRNSTGASMKSPAPSRRAAP